MPPPKKATTSSFRRRWGHRRSNSLDVPIARSISAEPVDAMAAAASSGTTTPTSLAPKNRSPLHRSAQQTVTEEVEGLTAMTMIGAEDKARPVSYANTTLPAMLYGDSDRPRLVRTSSEGALHVASSLRSNTSPVTTVETNGRGSCVPVVTPGGGDDASPSMLQYWKLEKELREAKDLLKQKDEKVAEAEQYKTQLTQEMDELTANLFEEAHEMVRVEKEARFKDNTLLRETQDKSTVLQEELKALKALVATHVQNADSPTKHNGIDDGDMPLSPVRELEKSPVDAVLFNEFMKWHLSPSLAGSSEFMNRVLEEDVYPCLKCHRSTIELCKGVLDVIQDNALVVEEIHSSESSPSDQCALCMMKRSCTYRLKSSMDGACAGDGLAVCTATRHRIIAVCNFYTYVRYIVQGLVKSPLTEVYWKLVDLRLKINMARLGIPPDDA
eukprot:m.642607 g.642607  ORF g.642607 m.642607 type:complete len:442 (+) comp22640_c0_seq1:250-1575(+)